MFAGIFKKIDKTKYPKIVQKWSFTAYFAMPVFTMGNRLYSYLAIILTASIVNYLIFILQLRGIVYDTVYAVSFAISLLTVLYLIVYGRVLAWEKLDYKNNDQDINKFQAKQKRIRFWSFIYYFCLLILMVMFVFNGLDK